MKIRLITFIILLMIVHTSVWAQLVGKKLYLNDGGDSTYTSLSETDLKQRINITNYTTANTSDVLQFTGTGKNYVARAQSNLFVGKAEMATTASYATSADTCTTATYALTSGGGGGFDPGNTIRVAKSGGDYDTIQAAVNAATTGTTILVYPGVYAEQVVLPVNVSLVGTDRANCIVKKSIKGTGNDPQYWIVSVRNGSVSNLTVENTYSGYSSTAIGVVMPYGGTISNCTLVGHGWDVVYLVKNTSPVLVENCDIENGTGAGGDTLVVWGAGSAASCVVRNCRITTIGSPYSLWLGGAESDSIPLFFNCVFISGTGAGIRATDNYGYYTYAYFINCQFLDWNYNPSTLLAMYSGDGTKTNLYFQNTVYSTKGDAVHSYNTIPTGGDASILGNLSVGEKITLYNDTNLYRSAADTLKTDDLFEAADVATSGTVRSAGGLKVNGTEVISSARALSNVTANASILNAGTLDNARVNWAAPGAIGTGTPATGHFTDLDATNTRWQDWSGPAIISSSSGAYWSYPGTTSTYISSTQNTATFYINIPYEAGTVLTRLRVKFAGEGGDDEDGLKIQLLKRDESTTATAWTVVGAQQTYTDETPVGVSVQTYDFANETMAANYSYCIEVEAIVGSKGVDLYSVGIESSKRCY